MPTNYTALPSHRAQNIVPQPTTNYIQRSQQNSGYPFPTGLAGQQQTQQQQQHPPLQHPQPSQQPQQSTNSSSLLPPNSTTPNLGTNHSTSSTSEVLDPNDFPALGSTPATNSTSNQTNVAQTNTTSYATQAGGTPVTGGGNTPSGTTGLTEEDFPALGGSQTTHQTTQNQSQHHDLSHPPGLNGFTEQNHRPGIISGITSGIQQPGVLNIGQQQRLHQFQSEADKRVSLISNLSMCGVFFRVASLVRFLYLSRVAHTSG
jgi:CCR4-NOT transcription complex subunit 2